MNNKTKNLIKNFFYTFISNLLVLIISTLVTLILPKILGIEEYGYWQLYILYTSYTALLHLGWNDGIYLRYGGKEYQELDKRLFFSQFWMLVIFELIITLITYNFVGVFISSYDKIFVLRMMFTSSLLVIPRGMLLFILQGTNRIKDYAIATIIEKIVYIILIIFFLTMRIEEYKLLIIADIIGKGISMIYVAINCRDIVFKSFKTFFFSFNETFKNIKAGVNVALAYVASSLIVGTVRFGIEYTWDIKTFGKVSLTLSVANMMMTFINAVGLIIFPLLKRANKERLPEIYTTLRTILTVILLGIIVFYYPLRVILTYWLPKYSESLVYMALIFPMCLFEGKMALLVNTYLKALRKEITLMIINALTFCLSLLLTGFFALYLKNLTVSVLCILFLLAFRCIWAEIYIAKELNISLNRNIIMELILTIIFVISSWVIGSWKGVAIYLVAYSIYILTNWRDICKTVEKVRILLKE
ncbi:oligosaccharide flippase family protein [Clostridium carnis]